MYIYFKRFKLFRLASRSGKLLDLVPEEAAEVVAGFSCVARFNIFVWLEVAP